MYEIIQEITRQIMDKKAEAVCNKIEDSSLWQKRRKMEGFVAPWNFDTEGLGFLL